MADELEPPEGEEVEAPEVEIPAGEEAATPAEAAPESAEAETADKAPKQVPWFQKRINELTAKGRAEEAAKRQLQVENDALKALLAPKADTSAPEPVKAPAAPQAPADFEAAVDRAADFKLRQQEFNRQSAEVYTKGTAAFPGKFDAALQNLQSAGVYSDQDMSFVEAAVATEAPEQVLYALGNDPDEAMRLRALPPTQMAIALDRMARALKSPALRISSAPTPITPLSAARVAKQFDAADTKTPTDVWMRERNKEVAARKASR